MNRVHGPNLGINCLALQNANANSIAAAKRSRAPGKARLLVH